MVPQEKEDIKLGAIVPDSSYKLVSPLVRSQLSQSVFVDPEDMTRSYARRSSVVQNRSSVNPENVSSKVSNGRKSRLPKTEKVVRQLYKK